MTVTTKPDGDLYVNNKKVCDLYETSVKMFTVNGEEYLDTISFRSSAGGIFTLRPVAKGRFVKLAEIEKRIDP